MQQYYNLRSQEYEQVYYRNEPLRQSEQAAISAAIKEAFLNRRVLEVACGTGFWTKVVAEVAEYVVAVDISTKMLAIAEEKGLASEKVKFRKGNAYTLKSVSGEFNGRLANFWFSHVSKTQIHHFLSGFHKRLGAGAIVFMADNVYMLGIGGELIIKPGVEDTFKLRYLSDASKYEIIKNYYTADHLNSILSPWSSNLQVHVGNCFWWVSYSVI